MRTHFILCQDTPSVTISSSKQSLFFLNMRMNNALIPIYKYYTSWKPNRKNQLMTILIASMHGDAWICDLLDVYDSESSQDTSCSHIKYSLSDVKLALYEIVCHAMTNVSRRFLLDTGAPKSICSNTGLTNANWNPIKMITLPDHIKPFRLAVHPVQASHGACLLAVIKEIHVRTHYLQLFTFVFPLTPIPFLTRLPGQLFLVQVNASIDLVSTSVSVSKSIIISKLRNGILYSRLLSLHIPGLALTSQQRP